MARVRQALVVAMVAAVLAGGTGTAHAVDAPIFVVANPALTWGCEPQGVYIDVATAPSPAHVAQVEKALAMFDRISPHDWPRSSDPVAPVRIRWSARAFDGEGGITSLAGTATNDVAADVVLATVNSVERTLGVALHELGHVGGLGHVDDGHQAMTIYPWSPITRDGVGDMVGLLMANRPCNDNSEWAGCRLEPRHIACDLVDRCTICQNETGHRRHEVTEYMYGTGETFEYIECDHCGTLSLTDPPEDFTDFYPADYYSFAPIPQRHRRPILRVLRTRIALRLPRIPMYRGGRPAHLDWMAGLRHDARICDVGTGSGASLAALASEGFTSLTGIDPFITADLSCDGFTVRRGTVFDLTGMYDVVMMHHSFEHMANPRDVLAKIATVTRRGARLVIRLSVGQRWAWREYGTDWWALDPPRHLFVYTPAALADLVAEAGFSLVSCTYDSHEAQFWVSEQRRSGISLADKRSHSVTPRLSAEELGRYRDRAATLNKLGEGDAAAFLFQRL